MMRNIIKSLLLLTATVVVCAVAYPLAVWAIGQTFFASTANGSMVTGPDGKQVGSLLIAQPFTKDEYFWPRPSAASYDASASTSSALAASNYALRDRVARMLGPIVKYKSGPEAGQLVAPDVEAWFQKDQYQGQPHLVAQWADNHNELAQGWVSADPTHAQYITDWSKSHKSAVDDWIKQNPGTPQPQPSDLAVMFFENFSKDNPGKFPSSVTKQLPNGKSKPISSRLPADRMYNRFSSTCGGRTIRTPRFKTCPRTWLQHRRRDSTRISLWTMRNISWIA